MKSAIGTIIFAGLLLAAPLAMAQSCNPNMPSDNPDSRYTGNGDGTVTDNVTGLMWKQCSEGQSNIDNVNPTCEVGAANTYTWQAALVRAQRVNAAGFAGHSDWRVPNFKELKSLVETACDSPTINTNLFPATPPSGFWSSSSDVAGPEAALSTDFYDGSDRSDKKEYVHSVRLVRTAH